MNLEPVTHHSTTTQAAVGKSNRRDAVQAGREAASQALSGLKGLTADLVLVFGTTGYDQSQLLQGVTQVTGSTPLCGCSGEGVITQQGADEGSHAVSVVALTSRAIRMKNFQVGGVSKDETAAAQNLAELVKQQTPDSAGLLLLFPDGIKGDCGVFLESLHNALPPKLRCIGGTAGSMMGKKASAGGTFQYHNGKAAVDSVSALLLLGDFEFDVSVNHGCQPLGLPRRVTKADGGRVLEIDGEPAFAVFNEYLDGDPEQIGTVDLLHLCCSIGVPGSDHSDTEQCVIRTPLDHDQKTGVLVFPGGGFCDGTPIQLMRRDPDTILESSQAAGAALASRHRGQSPFLVLQFDCAGRGQMLFGSTTTKFTVDPLQDALGKDIPWAGFHTFGEIAPVGARPWYHNYSVVVCALYERR